MSHLVFQLISIPVEGWNAKIIKLDSLVSPRELRVGVPGRGSGGRTW